MQKIFLLCLTAACLSFGSCSGGKTVTTDTETTTTTPDRPISTETPGTITFKAANDRYSAEGTFTRWYFTTAKMSNGDVTTLVANALIDLTSISEKSEKLADHLKAPDYFDVAKYASATMSIGKVRKSGNKYVADLILSMRDQKQTMPTEFEVISKNPLKVKGTAKVDRGLFGIGVENKKVPNMIEVEYETVIPM